MLCSSHWREVFGKTWHKLTNVPNAVFRALNSGCLHISICTSCSNNKIQGIACLAEQRVHRCLQGPITLQESLGSTEVCKNKFFLHQYSIFHRYTYIYIVWSYFWTFLLVVRFFRVRTAIFSLTTLRHFLGIPSPSRPGIFPGPGSGPWTFLASHCRWFGLCWYAFASWTTPPFSPTYLWKGRTIFSRDLN